MFGPHLTLDLYGCDKKKLLDKEFIFSVLIELPELIGMHRISEPQIVVYDGNPNSFDAGGLSAFVLIAESHITIHTFAKDAFSSVDIFSCREFDVDKATKYLMEHFCASKVEKNLIVRGKSFVKHYPPIVVKASKIVRRERSQIKN